jgi:hypothetical protein
MQEESLAPGGGIPSSARKSPELPSAAFTMEPLAGMKKEQTNTKDKRILCIFDMIFLPFLKFTILLLDEKNKKETPHKDLLKRFLCESPSLRHNGNINLFNIKLKNESVVNYI